MRDINFVSDVGICGKCILNVVKFLDYNNRHSIKNNGIHVIMICSGSTPFLLLRFLLIFLVIFLVILLSFLCLFLYRHLSE